MAAARRAGESMVKLAARLGRSHGSVAQILPNLEERLRACAAASVRPGREHSKPRPEPSGDPRQQPKRRRCLGGCGKMFLSEWAGNRVCRSCAAAGCRRLDARFEGGSTGAWKR